jgi:hypothetical protein
MVSEVTGQRLGHHSDLESHAAPSHRCQHLRSTLPGVNASSIGRPDTPKMSPITDASLL